jgi:hypothetical protein
VFAVTVRNFAILRLVTTIPHILRCESATLRYLPFAERKANTPPKICDENIRAKPFSHKDVFQNFLDRKSAIRYKKVYLYSECINIL